LKIDPTSLSFPHSGIEAEIMRLDSDPLEACVRLTTSLAGLAANVVEC
jgi:hypothetical protein